jgi:hypothetical protein
MMGAHLCSRAEVYALPGLRTNAARTVLFSMCLHALDADATPMYFAGSALLSRMLGYPPDSGAGKRAVIRAINELVEAGVIMKVQGLPRSHNRRWLLTLPGPG